METNPWNDDAQQAKNLTIRDDPKDAKQERRKELNSLRKRSVVATAKQTSAAGNLAVQTRWDDRKTDGCAKSRLALHDFHRDHGRAQPETSAPTPSTLSLKTTLSLRDRGIRLERDDVATASGARTAMLHADVELDLLAEPPEESELRDGGVFGNGAECCVDMAATHLFDREICGVERRPTRTKMGLKRCQQEQA